MSQIENNTADWTNMYNWELNPHYVRCAHLDSRTTLLVDQLIYMLENIDHVIITQFSIPSRLFSIIWRRTTVYLSCGDDQYYVLDMLDSTDRKISFYYLSKVKRSLKIQSHPGLPEV